MGSSPSNFFKQDTKKSLKSTRHVHTLRSTSQTLYGHFGKVFGVSIKQIEILCKNNKIKNIIRVATIARDNQMMIWDSSPDAKKFKLTLKLRINLRRT